MDKDKVLFSLKDVKKNEMEEIWDDTALIRMYEKSIEKTYDKILTTGSNASLSGSNSSSRRESVGSKADGKNWTPNDLCMAPYEGKWYPAIIVSIDSNKKMCKVHFNGYDEEGVVELKDLLSSTNKRKRNASFIEETYITSLIPSTSTQKRVRIDIERYKRKKKIIFPNQTTSIESTHPNPHINMTEQNSGTLKMQCDNPLMEILPQTKHHRNLRRSKFIRPIKGTILKPKYNLYKKLKNKVAKKVKTRGFTPTKVYIEEVHQKLNTKIFGVLREEDVEWSQDEPESALDDSAMEEISSQSSRQEELSIEANEETKKKDRQQELLLGGIAGTSHQSIQPTQIPDLCPPPPPALFGKIVSANNEKEALTNMLMSWYMTGYHTGNAGHKRKSG